MKATQGEREREIEATIALREREIASLEEERAELQSQMVVATPALREDPLLASFPVLDYCGRRPRYSLASVSVEQYGNTLIQLDIANKAITEQNQRDRAEMQEILRLIREQERRYKVFSQRKEKLADEAGINVNTLSERGREELERLQNYESEASVAEVEAQKRLAEREVRAARVITQKKGDAIVSIKKLIAERQKTIDRVDALYNDIRVAERETTVETEKIQALQAELEDAEDFMLSRPDPAESVARRVIDDDAAAVRGEREQAVNEERIPQERVIKAQDYRIKQLEARVKLVDKALKGNRLSREVERILNRSWTHSSVEVSDEKEELYDIERIIPAQEKVHPGVYNLLLTEKDKTERNVSLLTILSKEKEESIAAMTVKMERLARECNAAIQELDNYAAQAAFAEEEQRVRALKWVREQRRYCDELATEKRHLENESM